MDEECIVHPEVKKRLEKLVEKKGIANFTLSIKPGSIIGDNFMGVIAKAKATGMCKDGKQVTLNWIVKSAPDKGAFRIFTNLRNAYVREIYMYNEVFPLFQKFQAVKDIVDPFNSIAPIHMSFLKEYQECLIMEDMIALGYVLKNRSEPLDYNHVQLVMKAYGKFHAISYALKDQKPEEFQVLVNNTQENFFINFKREQAENYAKRCCEKALNALDPVADKHAVELFKKYSERPLDIVFEAFEMGHKNSYSVVGHGDSWVTNMLFRYGNPEKSSSPTEVCLLDFQLAKYGSPAFDLSYFIFTCTDKALRDKYYDQMISTYYSTLSSHLVALGSDPEKLFPFSALQSELRRFSVVGLYMTKMVLQVMMSDREDIPDMSKLMTDDEVLNSFTLKSKNIEFFNKRIRSVIVDFVQKGYLDFLK